MGRSNNVSVVTVCLPIVFNGLNCDGSPINIKNKNSWKYIFRNNEVSNSLRQFIEANNNYIYNKRFN